MCVCVYIYIYIYIEREREREREGERQQERERERQTDIPTDRDSLFCALCTWGPAKGYLLPLPMLTDNKGNLSLMIGFCKLLAQFSLSLNSPIDRRLSRV